MTPKIPTLEEARGLSVGADQAEEIERQALVTPATLA
jgi:hypothetical protein